MAGWKFLEFTSLLNCGQFQNSDCILFNHVWLQKNISQHPGINCFPSDQSRAGPRWSVKLENNTYLTTGLTNPLHMTHPPEAFHFNNNFLKAENCIAQLRFVSRNGLF